MNKKGPILSIVALAFALIVFDSSMALSQPASPIGASPIRLTQSASCKVLPTSESIPANCAGTTTHCSAGAQCCSHYHKLIEYTSVEAPGVTTNYKVKKGFPKKKWHKWKSEECGDHDSDPSTPNSCKLPAGSNTWSTCSMTSHPTHFVWHYEFDTCDN